MIQRDYLFKFSFLLSIIQSAIVVYLSYQRLDKTYETAIEASPVSGRIIDPSIVCMVNNTYMGSYQIPVEIDDEVYYGCCKGCVTTLKTKPESRFSVDPLTNEKVDKANALITLDPHKKGMVLYFSNEENVRSYFSFK